MDWGTGEVVMQPCKLSITIEAVAASDCLTESALKNGHHFSFGTKKGVSTDRLAIKRMNDPKFKAKPLHPQGFHWDGPQAFNFNVFDMAGNLRPEAHGCKRQRSSPWCRMSHGTLDTFLSQNNILLDSFSALFAILRGTYIETRSSKRKESLKVRADLGRAVLFTFSWKHRGKGDNDNSDCDDSEEEDGNNDTLPDIHARAHFYVYSTDLRKLPTVDVETSLEFMSICANESAGATADAASRLQVLDCLQTFTPETAEGHRDPRGEELPEVHDFFDSKKNLAAYVTKMLGLQSCIKLQDIPASRHTVDEWCIALTRTESCCTIKLVAANAAQTDVDVTKALFDTRIPSFLGRDGYIYELNGTPVRLVNVPAHTDDFSGELKDDLTKLLLVPVQHAMDNLMVDWHEANLVQLLLLLNIRTITEWTLSKQGAGYFKAHGSSMARGSPIEFDDLMLERSFYDESGKDTIAQLYVNATTSQHVMLVTAAKKQKRMATSPPRQTARFGLVRASPRDRAGVDGSRAGPPAGRTIPILTGILPDIARCAFPTDVPQQSIVWDKWDDCMVRNVGKCNVWNVHANDRSFDSIAIKVAGTAEIFRLDGVATCYDARLNAVICREVLPTPPRKCHQFVHFENVCKSFAAWALPKGQKPDFSAKHDQFFRKSNLLRVDCGGGGNCFYHSCRFWLEMYERGDCRSHEGLRTATVNYLSMNHASIMVRDPADPKGNGMPVHRLLPEYFNTHDDPNAVEQLIKKYCDIHGKLKEYVEDPIICVFAALMNIRIVLYHTTVEDPVSINDVAETTENSVMTLWCDGGHYMVRYRPLTQTLFPKPASGISRQIKG
jgi:hypothetical protein